MKNVKSTIWLDFINYIFIPFYILMTSLEFIKLIPNINIINIIKLLLDILGVVLGILTIMFLYKRKKKILFIYIAFIINSMITICLLIFDRVNISRIDYILEIFVVGFIIWVIPNIIYVIIRRDMFKPHELNHIKKCPGCKRIIPEHMISCGKCNYKEN